MPVRKATPEETQALFGNGLILFGQKRPASSVQKSEAPDSAATFPASKQLYDLQNLPEDPVIRPMLISHGVPRHLWPDGVISGAQADEFIERHGN